MPSLHNYQGFLSLLLASLVFFLCVNVMLLASFSNTYRPLIENTGNEAISPVEKNQLSRHLAKALMQRESIQFQIADGSLLFNEKEVAHMNDVAQLLYWIRLIMFLSGLVLVISIIRYQAISRTTCRLILRWSVLLLVSIASLLLLFFPFFFHLFHLISFRNDFWLLDPATDFLIQIFPQEFFIWSLGWIFALSALFAFLFWGLLPLLFKRSKS